MTLTNIFNTTSSYIGVATPRSRARPQNPPSQSQFLSRNPRLAQTLQRTVAATRTLRLTIITRFQQSRVARIIRAPQNKIRSFFEFGKKYWNPWYVTIFTKDDEHEIEIDDNKEPSTKIKKLLKMWLNAEKKLNLNPTKPGDLNYDTIREAVRNGSITLDWSGLMQIWRGKMLNIGHRHLVKYITGVGFANINLETVSGFRDEFGLKTRNLNTRMEGIRNLFSIQLLGFAVNTLLTCQPSNIVKYQFFIPKYLMNLVFRQNNERNELMYNITYKRPLQFCVTENEETVAQSLMFCIGFNIFRVKKRDGTAETRINLATVYPYGEDDDIALSLWKNHASENVPDAIQQKKFNDMTKVFETFSLFRSILDLYPTINTTNLALKQELKNVLNVSMLSYNDIMKWPEPWPELEE